VSVSCRITQAEIAAVAKTDCGEPDHCALHGLLLAVALIPARENSQGSGMYVRDRRLVGRKAIEPGEVVESCDGFLSASRLDGDDTQWPT
jgi:hypothetical protein